ncbi:vasorin [Tribolium castaneum]|uniref:Protein slit-like Protein n=1 Tax=Tribolium castaneum TaxID=7070 RepID=A0A139WGM4_TRICA|nr:PREDICTED: vasorin-like [Tribolium castaneum]KYB27102.1 Protein slit-like Protein [Tribolium castaneum]|eukprot:XP_008194535.1 PREDICTED: vasorin-like [Tribolium castaneum]
MICLILLIVLFVSGGFTLECNTINHRQKFKPDIILAQHYCKNVPSNLVIDSLYFVETNYPQEVTIVDSEIPTISNYSSLLNMKYVRKLVLKGLGIRNIIPGAFRNMNNLQELDLSFNQIRELSGDAFQGLERLETLHLEGNQLRDDLEEKRKFLPNLKNLFLSDNPIGAAE